MNRRVMASVLLAMLVSTGARGEDPFQRFRSVLTGYFAEQGLLPVLVDRGYQVGDVINVDLVNLYAHASRCFPKLKVPPPVRTSLADVVSADEVGMSFGLWLKQLFSSKAGADLSKRFQISFTDVSVTSVALLDLRDALDRKACPEIAPLIDGTMEAQKPEQKPFFVVSEVLSGKRQARLEFATRADLELKTQQLGRALGDAHLTVQGSNDGYVTLASNAISRIALKPVTVPQMVSVQSFSGGLRGGASQEQQQWVPTACDVGDACSTLLDPLVAQVKAAPAGLSAADLDR